MTQPKSKKKDTRDISAIMRKVRSRDTEPEIAFRKQLWSKGLRYSICSSKLPGKPDVVLSSKRLVVFIDGDFWHGGQWRRRNLSTLEDQFRKTESREYWLSKIRGNMARDCTATAALLKDGWQVLRFWESDIRENMEECVRMTVDVTHGGAGTNSFSVLPHRTFAEFFAGIGLMRIGLESQGWSIAYANDIDPQKYEMYKAHFDDGDRHYDVGDIHKIPVRGIPSVTLATASFPCNDLSLAGARNGLGGKQSSAFWGFISILKGMHERRPPIVMLENVAGFLTSNKGKDFSDAMLALNQLGYSVDSFMLDAVQFVPQSRQRLFVIGVLEEIVEDGKVCETPYFYESSVRPGVLAKYIFDHPKIRWRIRELPAPPGRKTSLKDILENLPDDAPEWWDRARADYLLNQMSSRHRAVADKMISRRKWSYGTVFRRIRKGKSMAELRVDGIAGCLRTPRGGSARQILFKAGYGRFFVRFLTPRECARLMGADNYQIDVPFNQALFGFGDAVCVPVIEWIAKYYLNPLINELIRGRPISMEKTKV